MTSDKLIQRIALALSLLTTIVILILIRMDEFPEVVIFFVVIFIIATIFIDGTIYNVYRLVQACRDKEVTMRIKINLRCYLVLQMAAFFICVVSYFGPDYQEPLMEMETPYYHSPISTPYGGWFYILMGIGVLALIIIRMVRKELPPLVAVLLFSLVFLQIGCSIALLIQLFGNITDYGIILTVVCILNFLLYEARVLITAIRTFPVENYRSIAHSLPNRLLYDSKNWPWISLLLMLPILCLCMVILYLFGQQPDSFVKAFTETSDWLLSERESPPKLPHTGHYLCTVSVQGHRKLVKPLRRGIRGGTTIWVNRQLLVANAFEQILEEQIPRTHRVIRSLYDRYGYPIAKHINTPLRADVVYILMKPLELFFLGVIYLLDARPESRIARQYLVIKMDDNRDKLFNSRK